jgi:hypothetical protein
MGGIEKEGVPRVANRRIHNESIEERRGDLSILNSKHEIRNPKQAQMFEIQMAKKIF